jgi:GTP-binding protein EngB required for normal cell division
MTGPADAAADTSAAESPGATASHDTADALSRLAAVAAALHDVRLGADIQSLGERVSEGRFYVACVGQFKRGKSTLLNALIGMPLLPTGIVPVTAVPTIVRYGPTPAARIRLAGSSWQAIPVHSIESYISEEHNPENAAGVEAIEVFVPSPLLEGGLCLVDTPGLGSVFAANTAATQAFVPLIDAALIVIGTDPPITGDELAMVELVASKIPELIIVLNKADRVSETERSQAVAFAQRVLSRQLGRSTDQIYEVSAVERLAGTGPDRQWHTLVGVLEQLVARSGHALVQRALSRGVIRLANECRRQLDEASTALNRPVRESEGRLDVLRSCVADAAHRSLQLGALFTVEQESLARAFALQRSEFLASALPDAALTFRRALDDVAPRRGPSLRRHALTRAREIARQLFVPWLADQQRVAEAAYREIAKRFVSLANEFLERLASSGESAFEALPRALPPEAGFRIASHFYFHELEALAQPTPLIAWWLDWLRPPNGTRRALERRSNAYLGQLLEMNSTRVQNDLDERVLESRRRLESDIHQLLQRVYESADRAVARTRAAQVAGMDAVHAELSRLDDLRAETTSVLKAIASDAAPRFRRPKVVRLP